MPLPELVTPTYELVVPSTKKKLKYRPFLVKEQKVLILALEENDTKQILEAIKIIFKNCIITRFKMDDLSIFDVEYIFLQLRGRSIQETIEIEVPCKDDPKTKVPVTVPVEAIKVDFPKGHTNTIKLNDTVTVVMKYPNLEYFCQSVDHPSVSVNEVPLPVRRITSVPLPGDKITHNEIGFNIILDEEMTGYNEMYNWLQRLVNEAQVSPIQRDVKFPTYADITLMILSSHNNATQKIK